MENTIDNFNLLNSFMKIYEIEKNKLPYHINILDLMWANENAHSRILAELLKQNSADGFEILNRFIQFLKSINPKLDHVFIHPKITSEKGRIDLLVEDGSFALIIENKIHNAVDQKAQLARYIEKVALTRIPMNNIYVVYLTRDGGKTPEEYSWVHNNGMNYRGLFENRFFELSYKSHILPWLKEFVLPNCKIKDVYLKSTIEVYVDYLEGMFNTRNIDMKMNSELQNHLKEVLNLTSLPEENYSLIESKILDINNLRDQLDKLKTNEENNCFKKWSESLKNEHPDLLLFDDTNCEKYTKIGIKFCMQSLEFITMIERGDGGLYYGIKKNKEDATRQEDSNNLLTTILEGFEPSLNWHGWKYTTYKEAYPALISLIKKIQSLGSQI